MRFNIALLTLALYWVSGCSSRGDDCAGFWSVDSYLEIDLAKTNRIPGAFPDSSLVKQVNECYSRRPFMNNLELNFSQQRSLQNGAKIFLFDINGVSDINLGVLVDNKGKIVESGYVSTNY